MPSMYDLQQEFADRFPSPEERRRILEQSFPADFTCPVCQSHRTPTVTVDVLLECQDCSRLVDIFFHDDRALLEILRLCWPEEFTCPGCGSHETPWLTDKRLLRCRGCRRDIRITDSTLFQGSRIRLSVWFRVMAAMIGRSDPVTAGELSGEFGIRRQTIQGMLGQLRRLMQQDNERQLRERVQLDELTLEPTGASAQPVHVMVGVELDGLDSGRVALRAIEDLTGVTLREAARDMIRRGSIVETDALPAYLGHDALGFGRGLDRRGFRHHVIRGVAAAGDGLLPACDEVAVNVKRWFRRCRCGADMKRLLPHLAEFAFRCSRFESPRPEPKRAHPLSLPAISRADRADTPEVKRLRRLLWLACNRAEVRGGDDGVVA